MCSLGLTAGSHSCYLQDVCLRRLRYDVRRSSSCKIVIRWTFQTNADELASSLEQKAHMNSTVCFSSATANSASDTSAHASPCSRLLFRSVYLLFKIAHFTYSILLRERPRHALRQIYDHSSRAPIAGNSQSNIAHNFKTAIDRFECRFQVFHSNELSPSESEYAMRLAICMASSSHVRA